MAMAGGATRSEMWLQMHADVTQLPVEVGECDNAPLLGGGVLAAAAAKHQAAVLEGNLSLSLASCIEQCVQAMVRTRAVIQPNANVAADYENIYTQYVLLAPALAGVFETIAGN